MFNVKSTEFNFQVFDYVQIGETHFFLSQTDIKVLDENLQYICRIPIPNEETFEKMAISNECILLMKNDFTIIGDDEYPDVHAPSVNLTLLSRNGDLLWSQNIDNSYGLAISIHGQQLNITYSGFGVNGVGEIEVVHLVADLMFNVVKKKHILRDDSIFEFPVCESVFDQYGRALLFNTEGEFYLWDVDGKVRILELNEEAQRRLINCFHQIRGMHFYPVSSELMISYSTGKILRFTLKPTSLEFFQEAITDSENSYQVIVISLKGERVFSSRKGISNVFVKPNALRFIEDF